MKEHSSYLKDFGKKKFKKSKNLGKQDRYQGSELLLCKLKSVSTCCNTVLDLFSKLFISFWSKRPIKF